MMGGDFVTGCIAAIGFLEPVPLKVGSLTCAAVHTAA